MTDDWYLRPATDDDVDRLHLLTGKPLVYRYLFDGVAPDKAALAEAIARGRTDAGAGMWVLEQESAPHAGCVMLRADRTGGSSELCYLLDPAYWGRGLATRMAWTAVTQAFGPKRVACVWAGVDAANTASLAVMKRLGMRFRRQVRYPLGDGFEYAIAADDPGPSPPPELLRLG